MSGASWPSCAGRTAAARGCEILKRATAFFASMTSTRREPRAVPGSHGLARGHSATTRMTDQPPCSDPSDAFTCLRGSDSPSRRGQRAKHGDSSMPLSDQRAPRPAGGRCASLWPNSRGTGTRPVCVRCAANAVHRHSAPAPAPPGTPARRRSPAVVRKRMSGPIYEAANSRQWRRRPALRGLGPPHSCVDCQHSLVSPQVSRSSRLSAGMAAPAAPAAGGPVQDGPDQAQAAGLTGGPAGHPSLPSTRCLHDV